MDLLLFLLILPLGVFMTVQVLAAWYGILDYSYRMRRYRRRVLVSILAWSSAFLVIYLVLPPQLQFVFLGGARLYLLLHLMVIVVAPLITSGPGRREARAYKEHLKTLALEDGLKDGLGNG